MIRKNRDRFSCAIGYLLFLSALALLPIRIEAQTPSTAPLIQANNLTYLGSFTVPSGNLGSTWGFSAAGTWGLGTYGITYNPANKSLFIGGHPYEQRIAEIAIPASLAGTPTATALQNLIDPLEGALDSINPTQPTSKAIGSAFIYNNQLYLGAFSTYDAAGTQTKSQFVRPTNLSTRGQVQGPFTIGSTYSGWVDKYAAIIPPEWQSSFGGPVLVGGSGGSIDSLQSWGPSSSVITPSDVGSQNPVPATLVLGYAIDHPLASYYVGNQYWSANTIITGMVFPQGTRSVLYFGKHGLGDYCYGGGDQCNDPDDSSKGSHSYPYEAHVWAYDANDLLAVKNGQKQSWEVRPYAVWTLSSNWHDVQGVGYDPATQRLYVSAACQIGDCLPVILVYQLNNVSGSSQTLAPSVAISANPASISSGGASTLTWSSSNASSCSASGAWSGTKSTSGTQSTGVLSATSTYSLSCTGTGGSASQSTTVTVTSAPSSPSSGNINVSNVSGLQTAIAGLASNQTILLADGTYNLSSTLYLPQNISNVTIKGASGNREAVIIKGPGMGNSTVPFGFWLDNVTGVMFQNMTIRDFNQHAIIANGGVDSPVYRNLHIIDIGDQFLKNNPTADGLNGIDNGILDNSLLEYSSLAPDTYTNGLDVHRGKNWTVRNNTFKNFWSSSGLAGPAVLIWNGSSDSTVVRNTFINNQRDIALGFDPTKPVDGITDHARGIIANNFFYKTSNISPDVPIAVFDSPQTKVYYNTVVLNGGYSNAIEYRFPRTTGVDIKNNLADAAIVSRDGASGSIANNIINATSGMFANASTADLHLVATATAAIDKGLAVSIIDDFDGQARPQGAASDIGADEYTTNLTAPAAPSNLVLQ